VIAFVFSIAPRPVGCSYEVAHGVNLNNRCYRTTMNKSDYYREEAARYRELAKKAEDAAVKQELLELAAACEGIADNIDDLRASR
jgi:hypothetical protein